MAQRRCEVEIGETPMTLTPGPPAATGAAKVALAQYLSQDVVGYADLDDYGDWRDEFELRTRLVPHAGFLCRMSTITRAPTGYLPGVGLGWMTLLGVMHLCTGRWVTVGSRWGWVAGPINVAPVYAPALVGLPRHRRHRIWRQCGMVLGKFTSPVYNVSRGYMNRVNSSNTIVNNTTITNVSYDTTIIP